MLPCYTIILFNIILEFFHELGKYLIRRTLKQGEKNGFCSIVNTYISLSS